MRSIDRSFHSEVYLVRVGGIALSVVGLMLGLLVVRVDEIGLGSYPGYGVAQLSGAFLAATIAAIGIILVLRYEPSWVSRLLRLRTVFLFILTSTILFSVLSAAALLGSRQRGSHFEHDLTVGTEKIIRRVVRQAGVFGTSVCRCSPDREARMRFPGGFETRVSIYDRGGAGQRPGLVLLHGNTWLGRNLSTYRLLASRLAEEGYIVLTFDYVGKGQSDDPFGLGPSGVLAAFDFPAQTTAAIDYLVKNTPVDLKDISIFGHSGGTEMAEFVGLTSEMISRVVLMVSPPPPPPDPTQEATSEPEEPPVAWGNRFGNTYRFVYRKSVPDWFQWRMTGVDDRDWDRIEELKRTLGHKPLLVVLGERDAPRGHDKVRRRFGEWAEPKKLVVIEGSDHYANSGQALGLVFYDRAVARQLVGEVVSWLESTRPEASIARWPIE